LHIANAKTNKNIYEMQRYEKIMEQQALRTEFRKKIDERDRKIYKEWCELIVRDGAMKTPVYEFLQRKYDLFSLSAVWRACRRAEKMLEMEREAEAVTELETSNTEQK